MHSTRYPLYFETIVAQPGSGAGQDESTTKEQANCTGQVVYIIEWYRALKWLAFTARPPNHSMDGCHSHKSGHTLHWLSGKADISFERVDDTYRRCFPSSFFSGTGFRCRDEAPAWRRASFWFICHLLSLCAPSQIP